MAFVWILLLMAVVVVTAAVGQGTNGLALISTIIFFPAAIGLYFSPAIVATTRKHPNATSITLLNLFLGWTIVGWVAAIVWAYSAADTAPSIDAHSLTPVSTKTCPFCAEEVQSAAIKCRHCGSILEPQPEVSPLVKSGTAALIRD